MRGATRSSRYAGTAAAWTSFPRNGGAGSSGRTSSRTWRDAVVPRPRTTSRPVQYVVANFGRVNVNRASEEDLVEIVPLSASEASAIVEFRMREREFRALEDLRKVPGVDFTKIQERKDRIVFTGP